MTDGVSVRVSEGATVIVAEPGEPETQEERAGLLVDRLFEIVEGLNRSVAAKDTRTVVDVRIADGLSDAARVNVAAFVAAIKGTIQALTLELPVGAPNVNLLVSGSGQDGDRERTTRYLLSEDGGYSAGTAYDLRGPRA
ncbi:hypothetical protein MUN77_14720 [Leucobacter allii]|uniref:hypothetical protein n=1 Tax=Leucobacter allii TaxID=2932247 RepID=UPI001FD340A6|nr:hypothetical protein [Leucobacter allii]UOR01364.1 hypothetical protein MUN77_14720 [Leucobacter allii]